MNDCIAADLLFKTVDDIGVDPGLFLNTVTYKGRHGDDLYL